MNDAGGAAATVFVIVFIVLWLSIFVIAIGGFVLWIVMLVEVVRYPDPVWAVARKDKTTWLLVVILAGAVGAIVYYFAARKDMQAAREWMLANPTPPPVYGTWGYPPPNPGFGPPQAPPVRPPPSAPPDTPG